MSGNGDDIFGYDKRFDYDSVMEEVDFDPLAIANEAIEADLDPGVFDEIDDRDIPRAPNWFEFMTSKRFMGLERVFPRQVEICTNFLGQFCPRCTHPRFLEKLEDRHYLRFEVNTPDSEIRSDVVFLENGVCPQCRVTRGELVENSELMHHLELAGCAGMRCVAGDTEIQTDLGPKRIDSLVKVTGTNKFHPLTLQAKGPFGPVDVSDVYYYGQGPTVVINTEDTNLRCSYIHPVLTKDFGYVQAQYLKPGTLLRTETSYTRVNSVEKAGVTHLYDLHVPKTHEFLANGIASHNSSKTVMTAMLACYQNHRYLMTPSPSRYFGLLADQKLHMTFVALTATQAHDTLWDAFRSLVNASPWFKQYHEFLSAEGKRLGVKLYDFLETNFRYPLKGLVGSFMGANIRTIRGRTRYFCVTGDTLVTTDQGLLRIDECEKRQVKRMQTHRGVWGDVTAYYKLRGETIKVTTEHGFELEGTPNHPIMVLEPDGEAVFKPLELLNPGDTAVLTKGFKFNPYVPNVPKITVEASNNQRYIAPKEMSVELAKLLGYLTADGDIVNDTRVRLLTADPEIRDDYERCFQVVFGRIPPRTFLPAGTVWEGRESKTDSWLFDAQSHVAARFVHACGLTGTSHTKQVPWLILESPAEFVAAYMQGYFDGDGTLDRNACMKAESASFELYKQMQVLLAGLGIITHRHRFTRIDDGVEREYSRLAIYSTYLDMYETVVSSILPRKRVKPQKRVDRELVPCTAPLISRSLGDDRYACDDGSIRKIKSLKRVLARHEKGGWTRLQIHRNLLPIHAADSKFSRRLRSLIEQPWLFSKVTTVEKGHEQDVYDVTIDGDHSFVAGNFLNHNTALDELGWFDAEVDSSKVRENAYETHQALVKSLRTVRSAAFARREQGDHDALDGWDCNVSSPSAINDPIMTFIKEAATDSIKYAFHFASWEVNPDVTLESLRAEMTNKAVFERDYGAVPPLGVAQFIDNDRLIEKCQRTQPQTLSNWQHRVFKDSMGDKSVYAEIDLVKDIHRPRVIGIDTGFNNNSFAIVVASLDRETRKIDVDFALEVAPQKDSAAGVVNPVNFPLMYEKCIVPLVDSLNVVTVLYDRWNSLDQIQRLRMDKDVDAQAVSLKYPDFILVRSKIYDEGVTFPKAESSIREIRTARQKLEDVIDRKPVISLIMQTLTVREVGQKIQKPLNGNDDLFRAMCLCVHHIINPENTKLYENYGVLGGKSKGIARGGTIGFIRSNRMGSAQNRARSATGAGVGVRRGFVKKP